ncbi:adenosine monophosphate-protein transferase SoFic [bacterium BMS3Bbin11]|nr:adenosine monophosphate-protein transferase SoFic [bacterium BMS3Abin11]GBE44986.1 adenosine monophosphate-protein transferase SoFic [bacterium BMS3Bbin11]
MKRKAGDYVMQTVTGESYKAYLPAPLPPDPSLALDTELLQRMDQANRALGRLDGISQVWPNSGQFLNQLLYQYVRKEAVLSSQIEGTQSSLSDLLLYELEETPGVSLDDVQEVSSYVAALTHGLTRLHEGFPLSLRLLREIHGILLAKGRGADKTPGEFRRSQNWLGGTRPGNAVFVPPPPERLMDCLDPFEHFLHDEPEPMPSLIKSALAHVQFETIHPFLDGNGRLGRMLITLLLCHDKVLREPSLYLSLYFKIHRTDYYDHLQRVRIDGDWEGWLRFFLTGVTETATEATDAAQKLWALFDQDRRRIQEQGKIAGTALRVHDLLQQRPIISIKAACKALELTHPAVNKSLRKLEEMNIVEEITGRQRNRLYQYASYMNILNEGLEPPAG